jgi:hypothetical protein
MDSDISLYYSFSQDGRKFGREQLLKIPKKAEPMWILDNKHGGATTGGDWSGGGGSFGGGGATGSWAITPHDPYTVGRFTTAENGNEFSFFTEF